MITEGVITFTWIGAGVALGFLLLLRVVGGMAKRERDEAMRAYIVENEALKRTNSIYRERIDQLEETLFSNKKYQEMAREIERLSAVNYKLRGRLKDLECLVQAEKKRNSRERVEYLEKKVFKLKRQLQEQENRMETIIPVEVLPAGAEVAVTIDQSDYREPEKDKKSKKWAAIRRARRI